MLSTALLTFTVIVHEPTGNAAFEKVMLPVPAVAVSVPPHVLVAPFGVATTRLAGSVSVKLESTGITLGLLTAKLRVLVALIATVVGLKLLVIFSGSRMIMPTLAFP